MSCSIIIVNYRTDKLVADCLHSLYDANTPGHNRVVIVDNNSQDNSSERLASLIEKKQWHWATLLPLDSNNGFAAGNNAGIRFLMQSAPLPDYILLLNPDTVVQKNAIKYLQEFLKKNTSVGVVGAQLFNDAGQPESSSRRFPSILSELESGARLGLLSRLLRKWQVALPVTQNAHQCDWVSGAAMMLRREVIEQIGMMDERYFLYFEEIDYCRRVTNQGWEIWLEPSSRITHLEGVATGIQTAQKRRPKYWYDSRRRYLIKHLGILQWLMSDSLWVLGRCSLLARKLLGFGGDFKADPQYFMRDLLWGDIYTLCSGKAFTIEKMSKK
jgi:GT2 family glycosyltransferase